MSHHSPNFGLHRSRSRLSLDRVTKCRPAAAYRDDALDSKTKELLGLVASTVLRCQECITYHAENCLEHGWNKSEILDALNVAMVVGGSITIPHIRMAWETIVEIESGDN